MFFLGILPIQGKIRRDRPAETWRLTSWPPLHYMNWLYYACNCFQVGDVFSLGNNYQISSTMPSGKKIVQKYFSSAEVCNLIQWETFKEIFSWYHNMAKLYSNFEISQKYIIS